MIEVKERLGRHPIRDVNSDELHLRANHVIEMLRLDCKFDKLKEELDENKRSLTNVSSL